MRIMSKTNYHMNYRQFIQVLYKHVIHCDKTYGIYLSFVMKVHSRACQSTSEICMDSLTTKNYSLL